MAEGWISLHRQIMDNFLWEDKPFSKGQAWIDLLLLAYHEDTQRLYRGELKQYKRGDVHVSLKFLAERWGWTWRKVKRFIMALQAAQMVSLKSTTHDTTISIVNYSFFQGKGRTNVTTDSTTDSTTEGRTDSTQSIMINNDNNVNNSRSRGNTHKSFMQKRKEAWENLPAEWYEGEEDNEIGLQDDNDGSEDSIYG